MKPSGIVTLTSDFGVRDPYVGVMKAALLRRHPEAVLVDLSHEIEPGRVQDAAFWLGQAYPWFPTGTVHLAVVDPGVGTSRASIVLRAGEHLFVGPDNGCFEVVLRRGASVECRRIELEPLGLAEPSRTFHGRDVFAPVAGMLARGSTAFDELGPVHEPLATRAVAVPRVLSETIEGEVLVVDRFGNLVTNVEQAHLAGLGKVRVDLAGHPLPLVGTYGELAPGACGAVVGSFGQLEVARRDGSAAAALGAQPGTPFRVHRFA